MTMAGKTTCVPILRFPDSSPSELWEKSLLGDLIHMVTPPKKLQSFDYHKRGKYPIIDQSQTPLCGYFDDIEAVVNFEAQGMIVFGDHTCVLKYVDFPFVQGADGIKIFHSKDVSRLDTRYLYYYLQSVPIVSEEYKRHFSDLKEKVVLFPTSLVEQKKIAAFLTSLDELISNTKAKLELLKAHKKGLMQKLFPAPGKTLPEYRFPEFQDAGEWEVKQLGEMTEKITRRNRNNLKLPVLSNSATEGVVNQSDYFDCEIVSKDSLSNYYIIEQNDFVYNPRVSSAAPVGPISRNRIGSGLMSPLYTVFRFKIGDIGFLEQYFQTSNWHKHLRDKANAGARYDRMNISSDDFLKLPIPFPTLKEQKAIASCLSLLDECISASKEKQELLKAHKKGLMQQLYPNI